MKLNDVNTGLVMMLLCNHLFKFVQCEVQVERWEVRWVAPLE